MKIKLPALILACALLAAAGCSAGAKNTDAADSAGTVTLHWMVVGEKSKNSDDVFNEFNRRLRAFFPDTAVEFEVVPKESYKEKWDMKLATNEPLDIAWIGNELFNYTEEVKKGSFIALDYLLNTCGQELLPQIPEKVWAIQRRDGKIYSVPLMGTLYRRDVALAARKSSVRGFGTAKFAQIGSVNRSSGYTNEACYRAIEEYLEYLKQNGLTGTGVSCRTFAEIADKGLEGLYGAGSPFVIRIFDTTPTVYNKYELKTYRDYFAAMSRWYKNGYIRENIEEVLNASADDGKKGGSSIFLDEYGEHGSAFDRIATEYEAVREPLQDYKYISFEACRNAAVIPRTSQNPRRAMEVLTLLNTERGEELYRLLVNGFERRHYVLMSNDRVDKVTDERGKPLYDLSQYTVGNAFLNFEIAEGEFEQLNNYNENALVSRLSGFELDTRMIVLEMQKIKLTAEEYVPRLSRGTAEDWESLYDEFIEKMRLAGSGKVVLEMQRQIDAFMEKRAQ